MFPEFFWFQKKINVFFWFFFFPLFAVLPQTICMNGSLEIMDVCNAISMTLQCLARPSRIFDNSNNPDLNLHSSLNTSSSTSSIASSSPPCSPCHSLCFSSTSLTGSTYLDLSHLGLSSLPRLMLSQGSTPNTHLRNLLVYGNRLEELPQVRMACVLST